MNFMYLKFKIQFVPKITPLLHYRKVSLLWLLGETCLWAWRLYYVRG